MEMDLGAFSLCDTIANNVTFQNLTKSYREQLHDASTLSASFIMFALTAIFFILNLFSRVSDVSAILDPKIRLGLTSALSIFLPVMSYLFSEAKNSGGGDPNSSAKTRELPDRAGFILIWMLLVELVRKKVEVIRLQGYSGTIERAGRVLWLGSLVFSNLQATGRKTMTGILWTVCACKLVQRISFTEFGKRSLAFGKNPRLISSYMASPQVMLQKDDDDDAQPLRTDALLRRCNYAVMDEDKLVVEAIPNGYKFKDDVTDVATVGKIWELAETDPVLSALDSGDHRRLRRLCLSFALFKLLRRRVEHLPPPTAAETRSYRRIVFSGLGDDGAAASSDMLFDVTSDELDFTCEYYHSVLPVALASPFFLLANYFLVPIVVFVLCFVLVVEASNGDVKYAFSSMKHDNYFTFFGVTQMLKCMPRVFHSPVVFFTTVDFSITFLLFLMFIYEELWEFLVFLLSDWFLVSLICKYATDPLRHKSRRTFACSVRCILFMRRLMHRPSIGFNQLSLLSFCGAVTMPAHTPLKSQILLRPVPVPKQVKDSITRYLTKLYDRDRNLMATLGNGTNALVEPTADSPFADLAPFCNCGGVAEVILTWHIATCILEVEHPHRSDSSKVAMSLSKYCAYLVVFQPELLPENQDSVNRVFKAIKSELFKHLDFWDYYLSPCSSLTRYRKIKSCSEPVKTEATVAAKKTVLVRGATLGSKLASKAVEHSKEDVWKVLANLWVELLVFMAPSSDEESVGAHADVLAKGGEFITVLWAMATHAGISRPEDAVPIYHTHEGPQA